MSDTKEELPKEPTSEEIAVLNKKMVEFWDSQIPILEKQKIYEVLTADIEEARYKRAVMIRRRAELNAPIETPKQENTKKP